MGDCLTNSSSLDWNSSEVTTVPGVHSGSRTTNSTHTLAYNCCSSSFTLMAVVSVLRTNLGMQSSRAISIQRRVGLQDTALVSYFHFAHN